jgi:uncharacterized RDD family membrane protein YckC
MTDINRFAPPNAQVAEPLPLSDTPQLASRWQRLGAAVIDGLIAGAIALAVLVPMYGLGSLAAMGRSPLHFIGGLGVDYLIYCCLQGWFLYDSSQTIGKKALGLRIVRPDNSHADFGRLLLRLAIMTFNGLVPYVGRIFGIVDVLFIFGSTRRCLHDLIVDTIVVSAASSPDATRHGASGASLRAANS